MLSEIYNWIESRTGVSYDFNAELVEMSKDVIFTSPEEFQIDYQQIKYELSQCCQAIEFYRDEIPDDLPRHEELKRLFVATVLHGITDIMNSIMDKLNIKRVDFSSMSDLDNAVTLLVELCNMVKYNSLETIISEQLFDRMNAGYDNAFTNVFEIVSSDITNIYYAIDALIESEEE